MKKSAIYTKTGDSGRTGLVSGSRVPKSDERIEAYGEIDELNSRIGVLGASLRSDVSLQSELNFLHEIQSILFDLGSNMACEENLRAQYKLPHITQAQVEKLERRIDELDSQLPQLKNFILPGGSMMAAYAHLARTGARNVERELIRYHEISKEELPQLSLIYMNRLSDYFFVLARSLNLHSQTAEIDWKPGT